MSMSSSLFPVPVTLMQFRLCALSRSKSKLACLSRHKLQTSDTLRAIHPGMGICILKTTQYHTKDQLVNDAKKQHFVNRILCTHIKLESSCRQCVSALCLLFCMYLFSTVVWFLVLTAYVLALTTAGSCNFHLRDTT